jgi:hypothetical protein
MKVPVSSKDCKGRIKDGKREIRAYGVEASLLPQI